MQEKNIAVLVSGGGTNLQAIIDAMQQGKIRCGKIALVLSSSPTAYALERAKANNIPTAVCDRATYQNNTEMTDAILHTLADYRIDLVVLAGFNFILNGQFLESYRNRIINVHPALIPSFCGAGFYGLHTHEAVLRAGVKLTGATVHFVTAVADGGPIIAQKSVPVLEGDTPAVLQRRVMEQAEWIILPQAVDWFCRDCITVDEDQITHISDPLL